MIPKICYLGPCFDYSGYGEANRHFIAALNESDVDIMVKTVSYVSEMSDFGDIGVTCRALSDKKNDYNIKILHVTPDEYYKHKEPDKYNIGHLFWETDRLPDQFVKACNEMDEIWTGSPTNAEAIENSGVKVPIFVAPQPIEIDRKKAEPYKLPDQDEGMFLFYSIFEWSERKNPEALLRAYLEEFSEDDNVGMLVKTYMNNFQETNMKQVRAKIKAMRYSYGHDGAKIFWVKHLMDRWQMDRLHATGDCYVSAHRGEGWGIPVVEAMLSGHPVISTGYNGVHDYIPSDVGIMLDYEMVPVNNSRNRDWYTRRQNWANVDIDHLKVSMRQMYEEHQENPKQFKKQGEAAREFVKTTFNFKRVGNLLQERLEEISKKL